MPRGRPLSMLEIKDEDRETLTRWSGRPTTAQALALRSRIVLAAAEGRAFVRTKTADQILANVARFCMRTSDSAH